jgi:hypothetical protein
MHVEVQLVLVVELCDRHRPGDLTPVGKLVLYPDQVWAFDQECLDGRCDCCVIEWQLSGLR